eukprot:scaffold3875_cov123-Cylindrotheca_fusiformis.AAC.19
MMRTTGLTLLFDRLPPRRMGVVRRLSCRYTLDEEDAAVRLSIIGARLSKMLRLRLTKTTRLRKLVALLTRTTRWRVY